MMRLLCIGFVVAAIAFATPWPSRSDSVGPALEKTASTPVTVYDPDPGHLWNRLHRALWVRVADDGKEYGHDRLDPLLWPESKHLTTGKANEEAVAALDEFLMKDGDKLVADPLKQSVLQRDLWAIFDWAADPGENSREALLRRAPAGRRALQVRLARAIQRLGLSEVQIKKLPDNYAAAVASKAFAEQYDPDHPERAFLPADLFDQGGSWVEVQIDNGSAPTATRHVFDFGSRSAFRVFLRFPQGRKAVAEYFAKLGAVARPHIFVQQQGNAKEAIEINPALPQFPVGVQAALVRQMLVVDRDGTITPTRVTENVQLRVFRGKNERDGDRVPRGDTPLEQEFYEFTRSRALLFANKNGGLRPLSPADRDFRTQLLVHGHDEIEAGDAAFSPVLAGCIGCHDRPGIYAFRSYTGGTYPRGRYHLPELQEGRDAEAQAGMSAVLKREQYSWGLLQGMWRDEGR